MNRRSFLRAMTAIGAGGTAIGRVPPTQAAEQPSQVAPVAERTNQFAPVEYIPVWVNNCKFEIPVYR